MGETLDGFVTRPEAELLWTPPPWRVWACDRTIRFYLGQFGIKPHEHGLYSRIDLLQMASKYEASLAVASQVQQINVTPDQGDN